LFLLERGLVCPFPRGDGCASLGGDDPVVSLYFVLHYPLRTETESPLPASQVDFLVFSAFGRHLILGLEGWSARVNIAGTEGGRERVEMPLLPRVRLFIT